MGVFRICDDNPVFEHDAPLSPTAMGIVGDNLLALDEGTRLGGVIFCGLYGQYPEEAAQQNQVIWRGGGVWLTGMTSLRITTNTTGTVITGDVLRVYRGDDDSVFTTHTLAAGTQTHIISIASGYSHEQPVRVRCEVRHAAKPADGYPNGCKVDVVYAEFTPVALPDAAPILPTFTTNADVSATKLTQLANYVDWLIRRVGLRFDPLFIRQIRRIGPYCIPGVGTNPNVVWRGGLKRSNIHTTLQATGRAMTLWGGATEQIRMRVNGAIVATYNVPTALGEVTWSISASLSGIALGAVARVVIEFVRTTPVQDDLPINRWSINEVAVLDAVGGTAATLTPWQIRQSNVSDTSLVTWLQSARTLASLINDRITINEAFWGVQRLYTARPGFSAGDDKSQFSQFEEWSIPTAIRVGEAIVGRGRALNLGYGAVWFDEAEYAKVALTDEGIGAYPLKHLRSHPAYDGDNVESQRIYLDNVPNLAVGDTYYLRGIESWVLMEQLKVVDA